MIFIETKSSAGLQRFVQSFWWMELDCRDEQNRFSERVLPDGSSEIIFHLGDQVSRIDESNRLTLEPRCFFIGQNTAHYDIAAEGRVKMLGIKFHPHAASFLLRENVAQFNDSVVDLQDILGDSVNGVYERIGETADLRTRIAVIERFLAKRVRDEKSLRLAYLDFAVQRIIDGNGNTPLAEVARKLGITNRYLEKLFLSHIGISPKLFAQIVQLQTSVRLLTSSENSSLTDVSYASGYYDQSHFIHAVKRFTGLTPSQLKREKMIMQKPFFI